MRSSTLMFRIFASMVGVSLFSVFSVGLIVRSAFYRAFQFYLEHSQMMGGPRTGGVGNLMVLGATEQEFQQSVDQGIIIAAALAVLVSAVGAYLFARALTRPLTRLTVAAQTLADGDLTHRVEVEGPMEVERLGEAFNEMGESLSEAETLRRRLVADVAHELRNPVAALRAQAEGMAEGILAPDARRLSSLVEDAAHLSRLVDDLQELSAAEAGRLGYERIPVRVSDLAHREVERFALQAPEGVRVEARCDEGLVVEADERRISQVLRNVIGNALRHTRDGEIMVVCTAEGEMVRVEVRDTGEGIPEKDLPYVFERFYRADSARAGATGGAGIGLAISKRIVEDHGGEVFASSEPGTGSVVGFLLPRA